MSRHRPFARRLLTGSGAVMALSLALPSVASAQPYDDGPPPPPRPYNNCHRDHTGATVIDALIGAGIGALFGANIAASGHRGDGAALGAGVGAVGGGLVGSSGGTCDQQRVYSDGRGDPGYADAPPLPPGHPDNDYRDAPPPPPQGYSEPPPR